MRAVVNNVVGQAVTCLPFRTISDELGFRQSMGTLWIQMAIADTGVLASILLSACRHLVEYCHSENYLELVLKYKGRCISGINNCLVQEEHYISDLTIVKTLALASDSVSPSNSAQ